MSKKHENKITDPKIQAYVENWSEDEEAFLIELDRVTNLKTLSPGMLSGNFLGQFLSIVCQLMNAKNYFRDRNLYRLFNFGYGKSCR